MAFAYLSPIYLSIIPLSFLLNSSFDPPCMSLSLSLPFYSLSLYLCCSLVHSFCPSLSSSHFANFLYPSLVSCLAHTTLTLSLFLPSRKSLSTICLAVMNSEPFRTNQLGQINETLQRDKLYATVRVRDFVCQSGRVPLKCFIIRRLYHLIYPAVADGVLRGNATHKGWLHTFSFLNHLRSGPQMGLVLVLLTLSNN